MSPSHPDRVRRNYEETPWYEQTWLGLAWRTIPTDGRQRVTLIIERAPLSSALDTDPGIWLMANPLLTINVYGDMVCKSCGGKLAAEGFGLHRFAEHGDECDCPTHDHPWGV